jgi:hypothetical protein
MYAHLIYLFLTIQAIIESLCIHCDMFKDNLWLTWNLIPSVVHRRTKMELF